MQLQHPRPLDNGHHHALHLMSKIFEANAESEEATWIMRGLPKGFEMQLVPDHVDLWKRKENRITRLITCKQSRLTEIILEFKFVRRPSCLFSIHVTMVMVMTCHDDDVEERRAYAVVASVAA